MVVSVHSYMNLERAEMTDRILAAIENPYTQIVGHPTGRLLLRRDAFAYDMERILDAARKHGVVMECNASPERLDLKDTYLRMAKERGVRIVISTDAHTTADSRVHALRRADGAARLAREERRDQHAASSKNCWPPCARSRAPNRHTKRHAQQAAARQRASAGRVQSAKHFFRCLAFRSCNSLPVLA